MGDGQKALIIVDNTLQRIDWIMHQGKAWLVPAWLSSPDGKMQRPLRIISLKMAEGYRTELGEAVLQYFQKNSVPLSLLDHGEVPTGLELLFDVEEQPDIWLPAPGTAH